MNKLHSFSDFLKIISMFTILLLAHNFAQAQSKQWSVPREAVNVKNPLAS